MNTPLNAAIALDSTTQVVSESVDDIPLLLCLCQQMGIMELLTKHFPTHGNWSGISLGWVAGIWLSHILSQADHRLSHVQPWAAKRLETLRMCSSQPVRELDCADDRLCVLLQPVSTPVV